jgi:hypothetical protein
MLNLKMFAESEIVAQAGKSTITIATQIWQEEVLILFWEETLILKFKKELYLNIIKNYILSKN